MHYSSELRNDTIGPLSSTGTDLNNYLRRVHWFEKEIQTFYKNKARAIKGTKGTK